MSTFVSVGNARQSFPRLLNAVARLAPRLPQPVVVQHGHTPFACADCLAIAFMEMTEFARHIETADLLILHAGAGSVLHALEVGKRPVVVPRRQSFREIVNDHQLEFARALAEAGRAVLVENLERLEEAITEALSLSNRSRDAIPEGHTELRMVTLVSETLDNFARHVDR